VERSLMSSLDAIAAGATRRAGVTSVKLVEIRD